MAFSLGRKKENKDAVNEMKCFVARKLRY